MMCETELIQAARQGDLEAFNQLVLRYQDLVYNQAYWILKDPQAAEDFTQDAFLQAYRKMTSFRGGSFRAWLLRIVTNSCYDELRRWRRRPTFSLNHQDLNGDEVDGIDWLEDDKQLVEGQIERNEMHSAVRMFISALPDEYRSVLHLVDVLEFNYEEAAQALQVPVGTVKSRLARARLRLRALMSGEPSLAGWLWQGDSIPAQALAWQEAA
jgi:RNA polymerase sigma-70 factor (ECF subfamily)